MTEANTTGAYFELDSPSVKAQPEVPQVIYVQNSVHLAGAQKSLSRILEHATIRNTTPILVTSQSGWLTSCASELGIRVVTLPFPKSRSLKARMYQNRLFAKRLARDLREHVDPRRAVVHANDHPDSLIARNLADALGVPSVLTLRSSQMKARDFFKYGCGRHDTVISVGDELYQKACSWMPTAKNVRVYNGVSDDEFYEPSRSTGEVVDKVLILGSMNPLKGWGDVVEALIRIEQESLCSVRPKIVFLGAQNGLHPHQALGTSRLQQFETKFLPPVVNYSDHLRQFPLVMHPSRSESFGMAALETVAAGVPLLAATSGMIPSFIDNKAFLFPPADVALLADRMAQWFSETDLSLQESFQIQNVQSRLKQEYSTTSTVLSLMNNYEQIVDSKAWSKG